MKSIKTLLSLFLAVIMVVLVIPCFSNNTKAAEDYGITILKTKVTSDNKNDILGDGKVSYDPSTSTLSLKDAIISTPKTTRQDDAYCCIQASKPLTISGSGKLTANIVAILSESDITIKDGSNLNIESQMIGIYSTTGSLTVNNSTISIDTGNDGLAIGLEGNFYLNGSNSSVDLSGEVGLACTGKFIVNNGSFSINSTEIGMGVGSAQFGDHIGIITPSDYKFISADRYEFITESDGKTRAKVIKIGYSDKEVDPINDYEITNEGSFEEFVERLYVVALGRPSEKAGKDYWVDLVTTGKSTGADCAYGFLNSPEFLDKGLSRSRFLDVLYKTFFNREADESGKAYWLSLLMDGASKEQIIAGFINSPEWCNICASCNVKSGAPTAKATTPSPNAKSFAERLYTKCLGREAEAEGLNFWAINLTNLDNTGYEAAYLFFTSPEFKEHNYDNTEFVKRLYTTFMGRDFDQAGLDYWVGLLNSGKTREEVIAGFASCNEFTEICNSYGINKGI